MRDIRCRHHGIIKPTDYEAIRNSGIGSKHTTDYSPFDRVSIVLKIIEIHCFWVCGLLAEVWRVSTLPKEPPS
jgi:hypothetical protein